MSRLRRSVKWGLCRCMFLSHFAACRGALHGDRGCHLSGPIPAGNYCAPAGGTHHPGLSSVRFFGQPRRSCRRNISPRPQLSPFFLQSPFSLHLSGGVGRALFDCQCWIRGIERGWQRAGGTCFGFVALLKWPLWYGLQQRNFAACRGVLTLRFEAHEVSGAIPAGSRAAPAGETCPPDLSSYRSFSSQSGSLPLSSTGRSSCSLAERN